LKLFAESTPLFSGVESSAKVIELLRSEYASSSAKDISARMKTKVKMKKRLLIKMVR
jgi:hypothetical protein